MKESSGRTTAKNPTSTAFGLGQFLKSNRIKYANLIGVKPDTTDPVEQIVMMRLYIENRYNNANSALSFHKINGWY